MQKLPNMKEEAERLAKSNGYYIPPYTLGELIKIANRIVTTLTTSKSGMTYKECEMVLDMVRAALNVGKGDPNDHHTSTG